MKSERGTIDKDILKNVVKIAKSNPRIAFYSPISSAVFNYIKSVTPRYSISNEIAKIVEKELSRKYPKLVNEVKKLLRKK
ncbi:MAG: hypothetical protein QXV10_05595 [Nitrososphaerota archaeon]